MLSGRGFTSKPSQFQIWLGSQEDAEACPEALLVQVRDADEREAESQQQWQPEA